MGLCQPLERLWDCMRLLCAYCIFNIVTFAFFGALLQASSLNAPFISDNAVENGMEDYAEKNNYLKLVAFHLHFLCWKFYILFNAQFYILNHIQQYTYISTFTCGWLMQTLFDMDGGGGTVAC
jgi:hypothetical protein